MLIQNMIDTNIKRNIWKKDVKKYYHKTFFMTFCGLKRSEIEKKHSIKLDIRIDMDDRYF